jgi:membrane-associated phospholipid phosphatase
MNKKFKETLTYLNYSDIYTLLMLNFLAIINLIFIFKIQHSFINVISSLLFSTGILFIIYKNEKSQNKLLIFLRYTYYLLAILFIYSQFQFIIKAFRPIDYDNILIQWDLSLLGKNAGDIFLKYSNPVLTEYLQIAYSSFYFLPLIVGWGIYKHKKMELDTFIRNIMFAYFFSYFLYLIMPAIGPRFTIYDFTHINQDLPGLLISDFLRWAINLGGGITTKTFNPIYLVNRDCMPSGHTMITLVNLYFAYKYKVKSRNVVLILGMSVIIATIYLRYHYFVDILFGVVFAIISILIEPIFFNLLKKSQLKSKFIN